MQIRKGDVVFTGIGIFRITSIEGHSVGLTGLTADAQEMIVPEALLVDAAVYRRVELYQVT